MIVVNVNSNSHSYIYASGVRVQKVVYQTGMLPKEKKNRKRRPTKYSGFSGRQTRNHIITYEKKII